MAEVMLAGEKKKFTMSAVIGEVLELQLDKNIRTVSYQGYDATGTVATVAFVANTGTDGAAISADCKTIDAGALLVDPLTQGMARNLGGTLRYIASKVTLGIVEVTTSSSPAW